VIQFDLLFGLMAHHQNLGNMSPKQERRLWLNSGVVLQTYKAISGARIIAPAKARRCKDASSSVVVYMLT
jgi:hypothetical protein